MRQTTEAELPKGESAEASDDTVETADTAESSN
jgi:hypothetical protein